MALPHAQSGQIVSVRPLGARLADTVTTAVLKAGQLEVMRVVLPVGKSMKEHQTPGEATQISPTSSSSHTSPHSVMI